MNRILACSLCAGVLACGGGVNSSSPYASVSGTVTDPAGNSFGFGTPVEADAVGYSGPGCPGSGVPEESALALFISTRRGFCSALQSDAPLANSEVLLLSIVGTPAASGGAAPAIAPGSYALGAPQTDASGNQFTATVTLALFDASCGQEDLFGTSGSVAIGTLSNGEVQGSFSADFTAASGSSGSLSGTFDANPCSVTTAAFCGAGGACVP